LAALDGTPAACHNQDMGTEQNTPRRSSRAAMLLTMFALGGSAVGMVVYQMLQDNTTSSVPDTSGFDIAETDGKSSPSPTGSIQPPPVQTRSRLGVALAPEMKGLRFSADTQPASNASKAAASFAEAVWNNEKKIRNLAVAYTNKHPVIAAYGRDWMSYPDLKKLNDDYMRDRDPIKFMKGVAGSRNFYNLVKKYAAAPPIQSFVQEALAKAPGDAVSSTMRYMEQDGTVKKLVADVTSSIGLPPALLSGAQNNKGKLDEKQIMGRIMEHADSPRF
jgi:hypothetical protein